MNPVKSLKAQKSQLGESAFQLKVLNDEELLGGKISLFRDKLNDINLFPLKPTKLEIFQINVGKMCNQVCKHCHVDAGPDRKEIMTRETMQQCIDIIAKYKFSTLDLTGGAPK